MYQIKFHTANCEIRKWKSENKSFSRHCSIDDFDYSIRQRNDKKISAFDLYIIKILSC